MSPFALLFLVSVSTLVDRAAAGLGCPLGPTPIDEFTKGETGVGCLCDNLCLPYGTFSSSESSSVVDFGDSFGGFVCSTTDGGATFTGTLCDTPIGFCKPADCCPTGTVECDAGEYGIAVSDSDSGVVSELCMRFGGNEGIVNGQVVAPISDGPCTIAVRLRRGPGFPALDTFGPEPITFDSCFMLIAGSSFTLPFFVVSDIQTETPSRSIQFSACAEIEFDDGSADKRKRATVFSGTVASAMTFDVLASGANGDPHLVGAHGEHYEFYGQPGAVYTLFSTPQFVLNMQLWDKGPNDRYIERLALVFRNVTHVFSTAAFHPHKFEQKLNRELAPVGGKAHLSTNHIELELCDGHIVKINQRVAKAQKNAGDIYHLDVAVTVPGCHDSYGGALGQTYQCRYASGGEQFEWSRSQQLEETFRVHSLTAKAGEFKRNAPCHNVANEFAGQSSMSGGSGTTGKQ